MTDEHRQTFKTSLTSWALPPSHAASFLLFFSWLLYLFRPCIYSSVIYSWRGKKRRGTDLGRLVHDNVSLAAKESKHSNSSRWLWSDYSHLHKTFPSQTSKDESSLISLWPFINHKWRCWYPVQLTFQKLNGQCGITWSAALCLKSVSPSKSHTTVKSHLLCFHYWNFRVI